MISFKIEHPSLQDDIIQTSLFWAKFSIGSRGNCQLRVITEVLDKYLDATQSSEGFFIESLADYSFIHNGKKYLGRKRCESGDTIQLDNTIITITEIDLSKINHELDYSKESPNIDPKYDEIMSALKKELIYSHKEF
jgi:hypothetical protein